MYNEIVYAGRDPGKTADLRAVLATLDIRLLTLDDFPGAPEPVERADEHTSPAFKNSEALAAFTGLPSLADDSDLHVSEPGRKTSRPFLANGSDEENNRLLLDSLAGKTGDDRRASLSTFFQVTRPGREPLVGWGPINGRISLEPRGTRGSGYESVFMPDGLDITLAEADDATRDRLCPWPNAVRSLLKNLRKEWDLSTREVAINQCVDFGESKALLLGIKERRCSCFLWMLYEFRNPSLDAASPVWPVYVVESMAVRGEGVEAAVTGGMGKSGSLRECLGMREDVMRRLLERAARYGDFSRADERAIQYGQFEFKEDLPLDLLLAAPELRFTLNFRESGVGASREKNAPAAQEGTAGVQVRKTVELVVPPPSSISRS